MQFQINSNTVSSMRVFFTAPSFRIRSFIVIFLILLVSIVAERMINLESIERKILDQVNLYKKNYPRGT